MSAPRAARSTVSRGMPGDQYDVRRNSCTTAKSIRSTSVEIEYPRTPRRRRPSRGYGTRSGPLSMYRARKVRIASNTLSFISGQPSFCVHAVAATASFMPVVFS